MKITTYRGHHFPEAKGVCVVIDVLRAFTTAAFAFASGAREIVFVNSIEEALAKFEKDPALLLMGEKGGQRIEGFHFENSPSEIQTAHLAGKRLIQRTSSGTQGVVGCRHASHLLVASFVVAGATLARILELQPTHVSLIVTGQKNGDEDAALAEYFTHKLTGQSVELDPLLERVRLSPSAHRMQAGEIAYPAGKKDLDLALQIDRFPFAIEVFKQNEELIGRAIHPKK